MIAAMKKFFLVILDRERHAAPLQLRKLGIAHVERFQSSGDSCANLESELKKAASARSILISSKDKNVKQRSGGTDNPKELIARTLSTQTELQTRKDRLASLRKEAERISSWGDFSPELLHSLRSQGLVLRLVECSAKLSGSLGQDLRYIPLPSPRGKRRFVLLDEAALPEGWEEFKVPLTSLSQIKMEAASLEEELITLQKTLAEQASGVKSIDAEMERLEAALSLERLRSGMPAHEKLCYFSGFVPAKDCERLKAEAKARSWALMLDDPSPEELPPTKIENPKAIRIIQPVFDFLGTVPGYREYDISPWFLIFFALFFAMIFGDGGYGFLMFAGALAAAFSSLKKKKPLSDFTKLLFLLSGSTMLWGLLTGSWFALPVESLPGILRVGIVPAFSAANPDSGTNIKIFCFIIGAVQLAIAHLKNIKRDFPNPKFIAQVGSLALVIGMFNAVLNLVVDSSRFPLGTSALLLIGGGFLAVLAFGAWNGKLGSSILEGLKGIIPTFLGTVSVFADIVSYIRLWAVSLAGVAISQTVNGMVTNMIGAPAGRLLAFIVGLVASLGLILAGHGLNFLMTVLSVLVHGVRLNMLEFSSHLGMEWSGYAYDPLREISGETDTQE